MCECSLCVGQWKSNVGNACQRSGWRPITLNCDACVHRARNPEFIGISLLFFVQLLCNFSSPLGAGKSYCCYLWWMFSFFYTSCASVSTRESAHSTTCPNDRQRKGFAVLLLQQEHGSSTVWTILHICWHDCAHKFIYMESKAVTNRNKNNVQILNRLNYRLLHIE